MANVLDPRIHRISGLEKKCRDALQFDSVFKKVSSKKGAYEEICALLDFIGDSESALLSIVSPDQRRSLNPYFLGYGLLQVMYSRQVAVKAVMKTLGLPIPEQLGEGALTTARHRVIGHPITNDKAAHVIVRNSMNEDGFEYWSYNTNETKRGNFVNYEALIEEHLNAMEVGMKSLYYHIAKFENQRRQQMRKTPLSQTLQGVSHLTQQIGAALVEEKYGKILKSNTEMLLTALDRFRAGLVKRFGEEHTAYEVDRVIEGVRMLQSLFPPKDTKDTNQYGIVSDGVETNIKHIISMAHDIDEQEKNDLP